MRKRLRRERNREKMEEQIRSERINGRDEGASYYKWEGEEGMHEKLFLSARTSRAGEVIWGEGFNLITSLF